MKNRFFKKLISVLAAVMLLSLSCITVFAAESNGSITITNAVEGQTYTVYKMFDLESYNKTTGAYSYKITRDWLTFFESSNPGAQYVNVDAQGYVTTKAGFDSTTAGDFAKTALAWAKSKGIPAAASQTKTAGNTISFTGLSLGYYLVDSSLGTMCALTTTDPDQNIVEKNSVPSIDKKVQNSPGDEWGTWNDATIGSTVNFQTTVTGQSGAENYVVHDKMSAGLTMNFDSIRVHIRDRVLASPTDYVVNSGSSLTDSDCTFEIAFTESFCNSIVMDESIVITYSAVLNQDAVVSPSGNTNETRLEYANNNYTDWVTTNTYAYQVQVVKTTNDAAGKKVLTGAEFKLYYGSSNTEIPVYEVSSGVYRPVTDSAAQTASTIKAGKPIIEGLDAGTYYLTEEVAPEGYNKLAGNIPFEIKDNIAGGVKQPAENLVAVLSQGQGAEIWSSGGVRVINQTGSEMPETGARGTIIFVVIGAILALGGYIFLVTKKRMDAE